MRSGSNAIEGYKSGRNGNALTIREDLPGIIARGHESMTAEEKDLLKWLGVFFSEADAWTVHDAHPHAQRHDERTAVPRYC